MPAHTSPLSNQHGFSLLEVLVSIIILSFGLLGMVGLQAAALQANREARFQSSAASLARELAEMVRGNKDVGLSSNNPYLVDLTSPLAPATASYCFNVANAVASPCANITAVANSAMTEWLTRVDSELPSPHVVVCVDSAPFDTAGLPQWTCTPGAGANIVIKMGWTRGVTDRSKSGDQAMDRAAIPALILPITPGNTV